MSGEPGCARRFWAKLLPVYRPSETITEEYGTWDPPNETDAREEYLKTHEHHNVYDILSPIKDLKEFGEGIHMYFYMLKFTAILFVGLMLVPGLLLVVFNALGGWYDTADLERTMLGNYGLLDFNGNSADLNLTTYTAFTARSASLEGNVTALFSSTIDATPVRIGGMNKRSLLVAMSALDLAGVMVFFGYSLFMIWFVRTRNNAAASAATTIKDYSARVMRLPADTSAAALKEYLTAAAGEGTEIAQVELCRSVDSLLALVVERGEVVKEAELALAVVQRRAQLFPRVPLSREIDLLFSRYLLQDITEAIRNEQAASKSNQVVTALVTFETPEARYRAMEALPRSRMRQWRMQPEAKFNNGGVGEAAAKPVALDVSPAPEPADIMYENLEYTELNRFIRRVLTNIAKYLVLLVGFLLVSLAPALRIGVTVAGSGPTTAACAATCTYTDVAGNYVLTDANRAIYKGCDSEAGTGALPNKLDCESLSICYECFCRAALNDGSYFELLYCSRFSNVVAISTLAQALAVIGIVVANMLIEILMPQASNLTPALVAWRFTQNSSAHLFLAFMGCGGVLFIFFTLSWWLSVMRSAASFLGVIRDTGIAGEAVVSGAPEFAVAVRSQLLVGPASYAVQSNPAYAHAFVRMEELEWERQRELEEKAAAKALEAEAWAGMGGTAGGLAGQLYNKRKRTKANRLRAKQQAAVLAAGGWAGGAVAGNQVAPEPMLAAPAPKAAPSPRGKAAPEEQMPAAAAAAKAGSSSSSSSPSSRAQPPAAQPTETSVEKMERLQSAGPAARASSLVPADRMESVGPMERMESAVPLQRVMTIDRRQQQ